MARFLDEEGREVGTGDAAHLERPMVVRPHDRAFYARLASPLTTRVGLRRRPGWRIADSGHGSVNQRWPTEAPAGGA